MPKFAIHLSRKRIKNINLRIDREGNIRVSAPIKCPLEYIQQFLQTKQNWIVKNQALIQARQQDMPTNMHREQMRSLLPELIQKWETIIGVQINAWRIRIMKSRWGSCNPTQGRICLNLHLINYPLICLEYVIVHELVHILEPSHNKRFYALMTQFMPEWKQYKTLLKAT